MSRLALTTLLGGAILGLRITGTISGVIVDMIAALLPVLVPATFVEPAAVREGSPRKKQHQNENPNLRSHRLM